MSEFYQPISSLKNQFLDDAVLVNYLKKNLPMYSKVEKDLVAFGEWAAHEGLALSLQAEREVPEHIPFAPWGQRIDEIRTSVAWDKLIKKAHKEGIISIAYNLPYKEHSRLVQMSKLYLFHASSAFASCPMAMTDGAALVLKKLGNTRTTKKTFERLTSDDPEKAWTSGQWMTEKAGGSDVRETRTIAVKKDNHYELTGVKWFSSAITAEVALALAYIDGLDKNSLSLFLVHLRDSKGALNGISINRLKDKLGTKALPTAELTLTNTKAELLGEAGRGVSAVSSMLNITRTYNSVCSLSATRRCLALVKDYAEKRHVFGKRLDEQILHKQVFEEMEREFEELFCLTFFTVSLLGKKEMGKATAEELILLRLFTPVIKMSTAKSSIKVASECLEMFGGAGYVEDVGIAKMLRDNQVFSIWEGTTNALSLDFLRAIKKHNGYKVLSSFVNSFDCAGRNEVEDLKSSWNIALKELESSQSPEALIRTFSFQTAEMMGKLLSE